MRCPDCERLPPVEYPENRVLLGFATGFTRTKVARLAREHALALEPLEDGDCLGFTASADQLQRFCAALDPLLSREEQTHTRALLLPADVAPRMGDWLHTVTLRHLVARVRGRWLVDLVEHDRLFAMLQPIVGRDGTLYGHESLLRGREADGSLIGAGPLFDTAREADLLFNLDLVARRAGLQAAGRVRPSGGKVFINFNPSAIYDPTYCLRTTARFIQEIGLDPGDVVFEVIESAEVKDLDHLRNILAFYRKAGFRIALDDVGAGFAGLSLMQELRPDVVKIDMGLIRGVHADRYRQSIVGHLIPMIRDTGALSVAEGIEEEADRDWLLDRGIDLMQGYLLGRPFDPAQAGAA
ncbi:EAL domain-containing protein [Rhodospirillum centenum]|uniref:Diguanylate phosphodiesterase (EAL) domain protein n=1 Tax=Rhodospirillum centenum (strain ATCC 51521 / SW) TaxID=414684 RepID=B6INS6_RHOCS|nr:EAL domain-containing protein [Rhodospirillum centenum]ACI99260.1 diguanylate phosphodiesterase (EAL) domain protein [Rhodospirillum centenum SW]